MARRPKTPALKGLQFTLRALQLTASMILLSLDSYLLAALSNHGNTIPTSLRAAEGIAGITVAYVLLCILSLRFSPHVGRMLSSFASMVLDVVFGSAAIYLATTNGYGGAGKCSKEDVSTPFGTGKTGDKPESKKDGFVAIPTFGDACRIGSAGLAVSVILIFLFIASVFAELWLGRNYQRDKRLNLINPPDEYDHSKLGSGDAYGSEGVEKKGFFSRLFSRKKPIQTDQDNALPEHAHPNEMRVSTFGSGALQEDRQPLARPEGATPAASSRPQYYVEEEEVDLSGRHPSPPPPAQRPLASHQASAGNSSYSGNGYGAAHEPAPYGEVPHVGGDLGYGTRNSIYSQPAPPYDADARYDDWRPSPHSQQLQHRNHDEMHAWRPVDRFDEERQPPRLPPVYRYEDGVYERV
jgi:hypothetical protein